MKIFRSIHAMERWLFHMPRNGPICVQVLVEDIQVKKIFGYNPYVINPELAYRDIYDNNIYL